MYSSRDCYWPLHWSLLVISRPTAPLPHVAVSPSPITATALHRLPVVGVITSHEATRVINTRDSTSNGDNNPTSRTRDSVSCLLYTYPSPRDGVRNRMPSND